MAGTSRFSSPALGAGGAAGSGGAGANISNKPRNSEDEGGVSMREVDGLLSEIAVMLGRWSMYSRFLAGKCRVSFLFVTASVDVVHKD